MRQTPPGDAAYARTMFDRLDFVYLPSRDVAGELTQFTEGIDGTLVFAIEAFDTRVAMIEVSEKPPPLLLAEHLEWAQRYFSRPREKCSGRRTRVWT